jgi:hypothetical protein
MIDRAIAIAGIAISILFPLGAMMFPQLDKRIALGGFIFGLILLGIAGGIALQPELSSSEPTIQKNESAPNFNVPGSGNTFNYNNKPIEGRDPDGFYQLGDKVGTVGGAILDVGNSLVRFEIVRSAGKLDSTREIEYREFVIKCDGLAGASHPGTIVGTFVGDLWEQRIVWQDIVTGLQCRRRDRVAPGCFFLGAPPRARIRWSNFDCCADFLSGIGVPHDLLDSG